MTKINRTISYKQAMRIRGGRRQGVRYIFNPDTGYSVNAAGRTGKQVIAKHYIINPLTGRLIRKDGKTYKKMIDNLDKNLDKQYRKYRKKYKKDFKKLKKEHKKLKKYFDDLPSKDYIIKTKSECVLETELKDGSIQKHVVVSHRTFRRTLWNPPSDRYIININFKYWESQEYITFVKLLSFSYIENNVIVKTKKVNKSTGEEMFTKKKKAKRKKIITKKNKKNMFTVKLFGTDTHYSFSKEYDEARGNNNKCVVDYLKYELGKVSKIRKLKLSQKALMDVFGMKEITDGVELYKIVNFIKKCQPYISLYIFDASGELMHKTKGSKSVKSLVFLVNNGHLYPIINSNYKRSVCKKERIDLADYEFDINYDEHEYIEQDEQLYESESKVKLIDESIDFNSVLLSVQRRSKNQITNYKYGGGRVQAFECEGVVYSRTYRYNDRVELLKSLHDKYDHDIFTFRNQTYSAIGMDIYNYNIGKFDKLLSDMTNEQFKLFEDYNITAYLKCVSYNIEKQKHSHTFDYNKSYLDVILNNEHNYNVFNAFDHVEVYDNREITNGEYYINKSFELYGGSKLIMQNGFYPHNFVKYCIDNKYIEKSDIKYMMLASYSISNTLLKDFAKYCINNFSKDNAKCIINFTIGCIGQRYYTCEKAVNTECRDTALYLLNKYEHNEHDVNLDWSEDMKLYHVRSKKKAPKMRNSLPVHRSIICGGIMNLDRLYQKVKKPGCEIVAYNVDSLTLHYKEEPKDIIEGATPIINDWVKEIGNYKIEPYKTRGHMISQVPNKKYKYIEMDDIKHMCRDDIDELNKNNDSYLMTGPPGVGKSYALKQMITDNGIMIGFTNRCVVNLSADIKNTKTIDSLFHNCNIDNVSAIMDRVKKYNVIYVDEYTMITHKHMTLLYRLYEQGKRIIFIGDVDQCLSVSSDGKQYDYIDCPMFRKMINNNIVTLDYIKGKCRQDKKLIKVIKHFRKYGKLRKSLKNKTISDTAKFSITKYSKAMNTSETNNNNTIDMIIKKDKPKVITINNKRYFRGMKLVGMTNIKEKCIFNSELYEITRVGHSYIKLKSETGKHLNISHKLLRHFDYGYSMTMYRVQGSSIDEPYNIQQTNMMSKREMYTAISRATKFEYLNLDYTDKVFVDEPITNKCVELKSKAIKDMNIKKKPEKKRKMKKKPAFKISEIKFIESPFKTYDCKNKQILRVKKEGFTKEIRYKACGYEAAMTKALDWVKNSPLFVN